LNISYPPDLATPAKESHQAESIANYLILVREREEGEKGKVLDPYLDALKNVACLFDHKEEEICWL
jgi:hypothetical protein